MLQWLFKYQPVLFEQGRLSWAPIVEPTVLVALLAVTAALVVISLVASRGMRRLGPWRLVAVGALQMTFIGAIALVLARPELEIATIKPGANSIALLLDDSRSMQFPAADGRRSRLQEAQSVLASTLLDNLSALGEVVTFTIGEAATRRALEDVAAEAPRTRLLQSLGDVLAGFQGAPLAAVVVLSDGADNGELQEPGGVVTAGVPIHTVGLGGVSMPGEVQIADVTLSGEAAPGSRVAARVTLSHHTSGPALLKVRDGGRLIARREVTLRAEVPAQQVTVDFDSGPGGIRELAFELEPPPGDTLAENNRVERLLTVREQQHPVLYLEGEPRWEYKFIRRALEGDSELPLTSWLRTTDRKTYRQDVHLSAGRSQGNELAGGFPATLEALYGYDVIVLGSLAATYLSEEQRGWLESFVGERGGSLLALAGRESLGDGGWDVTPLADVLPVRIDRGTRPAYGPQEGRVRLTLDGTVSPITRLVDSEGGDPWSTLPPLADYQHLGALKPAATTLLEVLHDGVAQPLLVVQPYGRGTAAMLATATTWRWRMRTPADDQRHTLFWRQLLRQLGVSAQQPTELDLDVHDDVLLVRLTQRDAAFEPRRGVQASATVSGAATDGQVLGLAPTGAPGQLAGRFRAPGPGVYRVDVAVTGTAPPITRFVQLGAGNPEYFEPNQNRSLLQRLAADSGGRYWQPEEAGGIADALRLTSAGVKDVRRLPLWDMPIVFVALLLLKTGEWLLRRRWGRV